MCPTKTIYVIFFIFSFEDQLRFQLIALIFIICGVIFDILKLTSMFTGTFSYPFGIQAFFTTKPI